VRLGRVVGGVALGLIAAVDLGSQSSATFVYVGHVGTTSATIAWGTTAGVNTIGKTSTPMGRAVVAVDTLAPLAVDGRNWVDVTSLRPDTSYPYRVQVNGVDIGGGAFRTGPVTADRVRFVVLGDFGIGGHEQAEVATAIRTYVTLVAGSNLPVRFMVTTGDNIYGDRRAWVGPRHKTGDRDSDWESKYFVPYRSIIANLPVYPVLGNHDGSESERAGDLATYLDNFFFPPGAVADGRYYQLSYGGLIDLLALDSTRNAAPNHPVIALDRAASQVQWMETALSRSTATWKVAAYHHPRYCAGPEHDSDLRVEDIVASAAARGVRLFLNGHEHNWQVVRDTTRGALPVYHVITGAAGSLRSDRPRASGFGPGVTLEDVVSQRHFTVVTVTRDRIEVQAHSVDGPVGKPLTINRGS
jgi:3',5'-cyclic AMP phosphodiesterase CpdA